MCSNKNSTPSSSPSSSSYSSKLFFNPLNSLFFPSSIFHRTIFSSAATSSLNLLPCRPLCPNEEHLQQPEGDHEPGRHGPGRHPQLLPGLPAVHPAVHAGAGGARAREPHAQRGRQPQRHREVAPAELGRRVLEQSRSRTGTSVVLVAGREGEDLSTSRRRLIRSGSLR